MTRAVQVPPASPSTNKGLRTIFKIKTKMQLNSVTQNTQMLNIELVQQKKMRNQAYKD